MVPNPLDEDKVNLGETNYIAGIYESIANFQISGNRVPVMLNGAEITAKGLWPWDGINLHIHRIRSKEYLDDLQKEILIGVVKTLRNNDPITTLVGECGITQEQYNHPNNDRLTSDDPSNPGILQLLVQYFDQICYFSHHTHEETEKDENNNDVILTWGASGWNESPPSNFLNRTTAGRTFYDADASLIAFFDHIRDSLKLVGGG